MDVRMIALAALAFSIGSSGCVLTQPQPDLSVPQESSGPPTKQTSAKLALAYARIREKQALEADKTPEAQVRLRDEARQAYQEAIRLDPGCLDAQLGLAHIHAQGGSFDLAIETYKKAMARHGKSSAFWLDKGQCHNRQKDWSEAIQCFHKALELDPENRQVLMTLGLTLARLGQDEQALAYLTRATSPALARYNLARMQLHIGQADQARANLHIALRDNPNVAGARELLAGLDGNANVVQAGHLAPQPATP